MKAPHPSNRSDTTFESGIPELMAGHVIELAKASAESGEVPMAAVSFTGAGEVLATAHNRTKTDRQATAHSELLCIEETCRIIGNERLTGIHLLTTVEPCLMCTGAIVQARLDSVFYLCPTTGGI